jgi:hypothetical protein
MNYTSFLLLSISILISSVSWAQSKPTYKDMMHDPSYNFYEVVEAAESYFEGVDITSRGSGYKQYQRWRYQNEYKFYPDGNRMIVDPHFVEKQYQRFLKKNPAQKSTSTQWRELGPLTVDSISGHYSAGLGRVEDLYVDPNDSNRLYLSSRSGGFWRSLDEGVSWTVTTDTLIATGVNTFSVSPTNPDSVIINVRNASNGTSHGIYRSSNGGISWTPTNFIPDSLGFGGLGSNFQILDVVYHPRVPNLIYLGTNQGVYRSDDNLQSWSRELNAASIKQIVFHPINDSIIYAYNEASGSTANQVLRSVDQGLTYSLSNIIPGNNFNRDVWLSTSPDCPPCLYFASDNGVWISRDEGVNFQFLSNPNQNCDGFVVNDLDTSNMIYGYVDLENSFNGGRNFTQRTYWSLGNTNAAGNGFSNSYFNSTDYVHADLRNAICVNGVFYVATDGHLAKSNDGGVNWVRLNEGTGIRENYSLGVSQNNHDRTIVGSQDNGTSIYTEKGWLEFYGADGMEGLFHPLNHNWLLASVQFGNRRLSKDGGLTQRSATPSSFSNAYWVAPLAYDPNLPMRIYDFRDRVHRSEDFGESWSTLGNPAFSGDIQQAAIAENNSDIMIVSRQGSIEKSTDGGLSYFGIRNGIPIHTIEDIAFDPKNDDNIIVVYARYHNDGQKVYLTTNGGISWTNITYNLGDMPIRSVVIDHDSASNIYLGAEIGVYTKPLNGNSWTLYNPGLPNVSILELDINYGSNTLRAATWGRGLWEYDLVGRATYPSILRTQITDPPSSGTPKFSIDQFVSSTIDYNGNLSAVYLEWSRDSAVFGNRINMSNQGGNQWRSNQALPQLPIGSKLFFKVFAVGSANDTSETYKYVYEIQPFDYCTASGNTASGNLYINNFRFDGVNYASGNSGYSLNPNPIANIMPDSTYQVVLFANTSWSSNDFATWIDFNGDRSFDPSEAVIYSPNAGGFASGTFTVPANIQLGDTVRLRNRLSYWSNPEPCGNVFGEVEDYQLILGSVVTDLDKQNGSLEYKLYPNPNQGSFTVDFGEFVDDVRIRILNSLGQTVHEEQVRQERIIQLDVDLSPAYYFMEVSTQDQRSVKPLIIKK